MFEQKVNDIFEIIVEYYRLCFFSYFPAISKSDQFSDAFYEAISQWSNPYVCHMKQSLGIEGACFKSALKEHLMKPADEGQAGG